MSSSEALPIPLTTPLYRQERLPHGLPQDWHQQTLDDQTRFLMNNNHLLRVNTYLSAGLEVGAQRLDWLFGTRDDEPLYETALQEQFNAPAVHHGFQSGYYDHMMASDIKDEPSGDAAAFREKTLAKDPTEVRGDRFQQLYTAVMIAERFGPELINTAMLHDVFGFNRLNGRANGKGRMFEWTTFSAIAASEWSVSLQAIAGVQYMHQAAARAARALVTQLLRNEPPQASPYMKDAFWRSRLAGVQPGTGIAYHLGYRAKAAPTLIGAMRREWGTDYAYNRSVFTTLLNMDSGPEKKRSVIQTRIRRPACQAISRGDFEYAFNRLREGLDDYPQLFSLVSKKFLQEGRRVDPDAEPGIENTDQ